MEVDSLASWLVKWLKLGQDDWSMHWLVPM